MKSNDYVKKVSDILYDELIMIYCNSCRYNNTDEYKCEDCSRKSMRWEISREASDEIANKILGEL